MCGCWDTKDINKRYLPVVMGIDAGEKEEYLIVVQIPTVKGTTKILKVEAKSISKGVDLLRTNAEKGMDLLHLRLFLISERLAKKGIGNIMDYIVRANDISIKGMVAIVNGDFEKTVYHQIKPTPEVSSYDYFSEEAGWTPNVSIVRVWEAYRSNYSYSQDIAIPLIQAGKDTLFTFSGSAAIRKDRFVGRLTPEETLINNIFQGKYTGGTIEVAMETSVIIKKAAIHHHTEWTSAGPKLHSDIHLDIAISESLKDQTNDQIAKKVEQMLNARSVALIAKLRNLRADVLGTGQVFRPQMTEEQLKDWKEKWFPRLEHQVSFHVKVRSNIYFKERDDSENL